MSRRPTVSLLAALAVTAGVLTATTTVADASPTAATPPTVAGAYTPLAAQRLLDTRAGNGAPVGVVRAGSAVSFAVAGRAGVPATGVGAVALTVTVAAPTASGYAVAYPTGSARPSSSSVNFSAGRTASNLVVVPVGQDGKVTVLTSATTHLVADVSGWYASGTPTQPGMFGALPPSRVVDTRTGLGGHRGVVTAGTSVLVPRGHGGVPTAGVGAVLLNVTVTAPQAAGYVTVFAAGTSRPTSSVLNFAAGQTVADLVVAPSSSAGEVVVATSATTHVVVDVAGYTLAGGATTTGAYHATTPARLWDNRGSGGAFDVVVPTAGRGGVPATGVGAVAIVLTAVQRYDTGGSIVAYRGGGARPATTNLSFAPYQTIANSVLVPVGPDGRIQLHQTEGVPVLVDVVGWVDRLPAAVPSVTPVVRVDGLGGQLGAAACAGPTSCVVGDGHGQVFGWDGTTWSGPTQVTAPPGVDETGIEAATCPTADQCVLHDTGLYLWRGAGTTWTRFAALPRNDYGALACTTSWLCFSGDGSDITWTSELGGWQGMHDVFPAGDPVVGLACHGGPTTCRAVSGAGRNSRFDGSHWSRDYTAVDGVRLRALSCATVDDCVAVGSDTGGSRGVVVRLRGDVWERDATAVSTGPLTAVSCAASRCVASDASGRVVADGPSRWRRLGTAPGAGPWSVGCGSATSCVAVSSDGSAVEVGALGLGTARSIDPETSLFRGLSCVSRTSCTAVGSRGDVRHFDGTSWTTTARLDGFDDFSALSCASDTWCVAVDRDGQAAIADAGGWHPVQTVAAGHPLRSVSCPVDGFCLAGSEDGRVYAYDGGTWQVSRTFPVADLTSVACVDKTWCLAASRDQSARWNGSTWTALPATTSSLFGVACATTVLCAAGTEILGSPARAAGFLYDGVGWDDGQVFAGADSYALHATCVPGGGRCLVMTQSTLSATDGAGWSTTTVPGGDLTAVSCAADGFCMAVNGRNEAFAVD